MDSKDRNQERAARDRRARTTLRQHAARQQQAGLDLMAAVEERDRSLSQLEAEIDRALLAALELGLKSPELRDALGVSHATFWRRAHAAGWKAVAE